jgi:L-cysteine S-thiosulfotransferase
MVKASLWLLGLHAAWFSGCATFPDAASTAKRAEQMVLEAHPVTGPELNRRTRQDDAQNICSGAAAAKLTQEQAAAIVKNARDSLQYPPSGKLAGDWKIGAGLVADGRGQRIVEGKVEALKENGALCINCHAMDPQEINAGNLGPALAGYGRQRGNSEAVARVTYERIYNAWAFMPCSNMPRLGAGGFLTPEQIAHVVAYLIDPQSPVNKNK